MCKELHKEMLLVCVDQKREITQGELGMDGLKQIVIIDFCDNTKINALHDSYDAGRMHKSHKSMEY